MSSLQENVLRIKTAKNNLKTAIVGKGIEVPDSATIDEYHTFVSAIECSDLSGVTATAEDVLSGKTFVNAKGFEITGKIPSYLTELRGEGVSIAFSGNTWGARDTLCVNVEQGFHTGGKVELGKCYDHDLTTEFLPGNSDVVIAGGAGWHTAGVVIVGEPNYLAENIKDGVSMWGLVGKYKRVAALDFVTAKSDQILSGYIGVDNEGNPVSGTIVSRTENDVTTLGTVVVPEGFYPTPVSKNLTSSTVSVSGNVVTITTGWKNFEQITLGTAISGGINIEPSATDDYVLPQNSFITNGNITLLKDPNYLAENIKDGVSMWGLLGTYTGNGVEFYMCIDVNTEAGTWTGNLLQNEGFTEDAINLTGYKGFIPEVGKIYSKDTRFLVDITEYKEPAILRCYIPLETDCQPTTGQTITPYNVPIFTENQGISSCAAFSGNFVNVNIDYAVAPLPTGSTARTISVFTFPYTSKLKNIFWYGDLVSQQWFALYASATQVAIDFCDNRPTFDIPLEYQAKWMHVAFTFDGDSLTCYIDGNLIGESEVVGVNTAQRSGGLGARDGSTDKYNGCVRELKVWGGCLTQEEVKSEADRCFALIDSGTSPELPEGYKLQLSGVKEPGDSCNGIYTMESATATGTDRVWINDNGSGYKIVYDTNLGWMLYDGSAVIPPQFNADNPWEATGVNDLDGNPVTLIIYSDSGTSPELPEGYKLVISGADETSCPGWNGTYTMVDTAVTGYDRVWKNDNNDYVISYMLDGCTLWTLGKRDGLEPDGQYYMGSVFTTLGNEQDADPWTNGNGSDLSGNVVSVTIVE